MTYAIVFSSRTGNTRQLAEALRDALPAADCRYFGAPDAAALAAERLYIGFWTDKGCCDAALADFLAQLTTQQVFLFGTAGFGEDAAYFDAILARVAEKLPPGVEKLGGYMCQGRMPQAVRDRYEKMAADPAQHDRAQQMIANFDRALAHPDAGDCARLVAMVQQLEDGR